MPQPQTTFDWRIYADATFAGLAVLIPIPVLDSAFERMFRRRMAPAIARHRGRDLAPAIRRQLNQGNQGFLAACLALPVAATLGLVKRFSRKLLYVLAIKDAASQISYYWQRAFLIDYMLAAGHLDDPAAAQVAQAAMEQVLQAASSPLAQLAVQVIDSTRHVVQTLWRARRGVENEVIHQIQARMTQQWTHFDVYLTALAADYEHAYQQLLSRPSEAASPHHNRTR